MTAVTMLLAQMVLTLRSVLFVRDRFVLITTERNRIYAVTKKNRVVTSCFGVITISEFVLGLYVSAHAATRGGESVTGCHSRFLPAMFQRNLSYRFHFPYT